MEFIEGVIGFLKSGHVDSWIVFIVLVSEYWLGKTALVKAGSSIEVVLSTIKKIGGFLKGMLPK